MKIRGGKWGLLSYKIPEGKDYNDEMRYFLFSFDRCPSFIGKWEKSINALCVQTKILFCFEDSEEFLAPGAKEEQNQKFEERKTETKKRFFFPNYFV